MRRASLSPPTDSRTPAPRPRPRPTVLVEPYRRRASDLVKLVVALGLLVFLALRATQISIAELDVFLAFNTLPDSLEPLFRALSQLGTLWAVLFVAGAALADRRWRLARAVLIAGVVAWGVARVLGTEVVSQVGLGHSLGTLTHAGPTPNFPLVRLTVAVAMVAAAGPYLTRPSRRSIAVLAVAIALGSMYIGTAYPVDVLGGVVLGLGVAAGVHLGFGHPGGRPSETQLERALPRIGIDPHTLRLAPERDADATVFEAEDREGRLLVKVLGRDELDAQLLAKTWRFLAYKEPAPPLQLTRVQQVEHEACMTLLAGSAGIRVPDVVYVGRAGPAAAVLVSRPLRGRRLSDVSPSVVTDAFLGSLWDEVDRLHGAGMVHGALDADHVIFTGAGPGIVGFARATTLGFEVRRPQDIAELLATTSSIVGDERAVRACMGVLGGPALISALPYLQPAALRPTTRAALAARHHRGLQPRLDELRRTAATASGVRPPALQHLQRIRPAQAILAASSLVAVAILLTQVGPPGRVWSAVRHADFAWLAASLAISLAANIGWAIAFMGTIPIRLPLWPTTELQLSMCYSNLVVPVLGGAGFQIRYLQRQGADLPSAVAAGGLVSASGTLLAQVPLFGIALWLSPNRLRFGRVPVSGILEAVMIIVVSLAAVAAVTLGIPRLRRAVLPPIRVGWATIRATLGNGRQLMLLMGGNVGVALMLGVCLLTCLFAFDKTLSFWTVLALSIGTGALSSLVPLPGGGTAAGAVGLAGVLAGLGIPADVAVATALAHSLVVTYLPALPGWFAVRHLIKKDYL